MANIEVNQRTIDLIKQFEGFRAKTYKDAVGVPTIGYGTTAAAGLGITPGPGMVITEHEAERLLQAGLDKFGAKIRNKITAPINENEWGAFLSLAYNIGPGAFAKSSALRKFNAGDKAGAANAILLWNKAGGKVLKGLVRRRVAERDLFLTPTGRVLPGTRPATDVSGLTVIRNKDGKIIGMAAANKPAQAQKSAPASSVKETAKGVSAGAGLVVVVVALWDQIKAVLGKLAAFYDALTPWN